MAKKKSSRAKTSAKKKKTTVKDLAPKKSARGGVAGLNPSSAGNTVGGSLGIDSLRSR